MFLDGDQKGIRKVAEIRMEYHRGPRGNLIRHLTGLGYSTRQFMSEGSGGGYLWLTRDETP